MQWNPFITRRIYLDHAAATPLRPEILKRMRPFESTIYANASAVHKEGLAARAALEAARAEAAEVLATTKRNIVFTSGGTESNNAAIFGVIEKAHETGRSYDDMEVVTTPIEHPSILEPLRALKSRGVKILYAPVDSEGYIQADAFRKLLSPRTVLVSFAYANSEIGTVQDVKVLSRVVRLYRKEQGNMYPFVHLDASQAPLWLPCRMDSLGIDLMSIDAGKCYGPKGVGILALRGEVPLAPLLRGGSQEGGIRPGTENVGLAVGCAAALQCAQAEWETRATRIAQLRNEFLKNLQATFPNLIVTGPADLSISSRLANSASIAIPGLDGEYAVIGLDHRGIACSTRSACKVNEAIEEGGSHVLRALGLPTDTVLGAIRFSLGEGTKGYELTAAVQALKKHTSIAVSDTHSF